MYYFAMFIICTFVSQPVPHPKRWANSATLHTTAHKGCVIIRALRYVNISTIRRNSCSNGTMSDILVTKVVRSIKILKSFVSSGAQVRS